MEFAFARTTRCSQTKYGFLIKIIKGENEQRERERKRKKERNRSGIHLPDGELRFQRNRGINKANAELFTMANLAWITRIIVFVEKRVRGRKEEEGWRAF